MFKKTWAAALLLLMITAAAIACGPDAGIQPDLQEEPTPTPQQDRTERPSETPATATPESTTEDHTTETPETPQATPATVKKAPTAENQASPPAGTRATTTPTASSEGPKIYPVVAHEPFDPVNGPEGTMEELLAEIDFVIKVHMERIWTEKNDSQVNVLMKGRLSEPYAHRCHPREMGGPLESEFKGVYVASQRSQGKPIEDNLEAVLREVSHEITITSFDGRTAQVELLFHTKAGTYEQEFATPLDRWIYVEGRPQDGNRWAMDPPESTGGRRC